MSRIWVFVVASALVVTGCAGGADGGAPAVRTPPAVAGRLSGMFPGLAYRYGGMARLRHHAPPASLALPGGASDLPAAGRVVLAADDVGIWRSTDGRQRWRAVLVGLPMWSLTAVAGGGLAATVNRPTANGLGRPLLAATAGPIPGSAPGPCTAG